MNEELNTQNSGIRFCIGENSYLKMKSIKEAIYCPHYGCKQK